MKTKKLNLKDLKVDSFVTSLDGRDSQTVKGGTATAAPVEVVSAVVAVVGVVVAAGALTYEVANDQSFALCSEDNNPKVVVINRNSNNNNKPGKKK